MPQNPMQLLAVCVAEPREVAYRGKTVRSSIWKKAVDGPVATTRLNLDGDRQATAVIHGGVNKAAYAYSHDHYDWWQRQLQRTDLDPGMFGENLVISGLDEARCQVGEQWQIGSVRYAITGPRIPCANLAMKFNDREVPQRFTESARPGVYLRVVQTGSLQAGDDVTVHAAGAGPTIQQMYRAYTHPGEPGSSAILQQTLANPWLDPEFARGIKKRIKTAPQPAGVNLETQV